MVTPNHQNQMIGKNECWGVSLSLTNDCGVMYIGAGQGIDSTEQQLRFKRISKIK
jgi:uncharacterized membrane protein